MPYPEHKKTAHTYISWIMHIWFYLRTVIGVLGWNHECYIWMVADWYHDRHMLLTMDFGLPQPLSGNWGWLRKRGLLYHFIEPCHARETWTFSETKHHWLSCIGHAYFRQPLYSMISHSWRPQNKITHAWGHVPPSATFHFLDCNVIATIYLY